MLMGLKLMIHAHKCNIVIPVIRLYNIFLLFFYPLENSYDGECRRFHCLISFQEHSEEELKAWKLVRVSEDFRVIALGLPVPRYHGNPLDPPLRSRFQARDIHLLPFKVRVENTFWNACYIHLSILMYYSSLSPNKGEIFNLFYFPLVPSINFNISKLVYLYL